MEIKVVIIYPNKAPKITEIDDDLFVYQRIVDGYVEAIHIGEELTALVNEDGKMLGMTPNFSIGYTTIVGPAIIVRDRGKVGYEGLLSYQVEEALKIFNEGRIKWNTYY